MRKISICSSGARRIAGVDLEVDGELAVGGQELDVAAQRGVERGRSARRRQGEDREARLLLRERGRLRELRGDLVHRRARFEHLGVRRDREQVLGQSVVDLARDARPLLRDGAPELGEADGPPRADEHDREREQAQEVALRRRSSGRAAA